MHWSNCSLALSHWCGFKRASEVTLKDTVKLPALNHNKIPQHDDVIKWEHFLHYWPFVRGIHRSPLDSPHKGQWCWALMFSLICARTNGWTNNRDPGGLRHHRTHYDISVMNHCNSPVRHSVDQNREITEVYLSLGSHLPHMLLRFHIVG